MHRGLLLILLSSGVLAGELPYYPVESFIHLEKNTNRNQVHYGVRTDSTCRPIGRKPVYAYWLVLEEGIDKTESLRFWELPGYGVRQPESIDLSDSGASFVFQIRGVPERVISLVVAMHGGECRAQAMLEIAGRQAVFDHIEIEVSGWANVHTVEIFGIDLDGNPVREVTHSDSRGD